MAYIWDYKILIL